MKVELDFSNNTTKSNLKNVTDVSIDIWGSLVQFHSKSENSISDDLFEISFKSIFTLAF